MEQQFIIKGGQVFNGSVTIPGAKNAVLPIFFATMLGTDTITLENVPKLTDISVSINMFKCLGADVTPDLEHNKITLYPQDIKTQEIPYKYASKIRASIWALAPLVARFGYGKVALPGGCAIGSRPVDMHLFALEKLGAELEIENGNVIARAPNGLTGAKIFFDKVSVGATATAVMAAVLAKGTTYIENVATEPEMVDLCNYLVQLGAKITGIGTRNLQIEGVDSLGGNLSYSVIPDRIECASYLIAAVVSRSKVTCKNVNPRHLEVVLSKLQEAGATITCTEDTITCDMNGKRAKAVDIITAPYPGMPTDMQAQFTLLNCLAEGNAIVTETIFENRFMHVPELMRMGALIKQKGNTIYIQGVEEFSGAEVKATDLRASIALVLAGCVAKGTTIVDHIFHIDRGYANIESQLKDLNCEIKRVNLESE